MSLIMPSKATFYILLIFVSLDILPAAGQHSVAREWNEVLLEAIRNDFARPTVHARNLFHVSVAMYDAWAAYEELAKPYLLGDTIGNYYTPFTGIDFQGLSVQDRKVAKEEAISYAAYRIMKHRFQNSPGAAFSLPLMDTCLCTGFTGDKQSVSAKTVVLDRISIIEIANWSDCIQ